MTTTTFDNLRLKKVEGGYGVTLDAHRVGTVRQFQRGSGWKQWRFRLDVTFPLAGRYVALGNTRAEAVERGIGFVTHVREAQRLLEADTEMVNVFWNDLIEYAEKYRESTARDEERLGYGRMGETSRRYSGALSYLIDKLYARGFDRSVLVQVAHGSTEDWQQEEVA